MSTSNDRLRRHRAHKAGDHSLCRPQFCPVADAAAPSPPPRVTLAPAPTPAPEPERERAPAEPEQRDRTSRALWDELSPTLGVAHRVLLTQVCRMADRLDELEALIDGRNRRGVWLQLVTADDGVTRVVVDDLIAEFRQQALALKGLLAELRQAGVLKAAAPEKPKEGGLADLTARIADRRRSPSG